jgi:hypothetical protein
MSISYFLLPLFDPSTGLAHGHIEDLCQVGPGTDVIHPVSVSLFLTVEVSLLVAFDCVLIPRDTAEVFDIRARSVLTSVVNFKTFRDGTPTKLPDDPMKHHAT